MSLDRICIRMSELRIIYRTQIRICKSRHRCIIFRTMHKMLDLISHRWIEGRPKIIGYIISRDSRSLHNDILLITNITIMIMIRMRDNRNRNIFNRLISIMWDIIVCIALGIDSSVFLHGSVWEIVGIVVYHGGDMELLVYFFIFFLNLWNIIG